MTRVPSNMVSIMETSPIMTLGIWPSWLDNKLGVNLVVSEWVVIILIDFFKVVATETFFVFTLHLGNIPILTNIFQRG